MAGKSLGCPLPAGHDLPHAPQFHRIDDALQSIFNDTVTPWEMVYYKRYYEYDTIADLADRET
jgi:tyrosinase